MDSRLEGLYDMVLTWPLITLQVSMVVNQISDSLTVV
jgi:hypothetical protein